MAAAPNRELMSSTMRCLELLEILAREPYAFRLAELADRLSISKSSAHRRLAMLVAAGFIEQDPVSGAYHVSGKAFWIGTGYLRHSAVYRSGFAVLENLAERAGTMAHLGVWDSDTVLCLHSIGSPSCVPLFTDTGGRDPVHATAQGKILLAHRPAEVLERVFAQGRTRYTPNTITSLPKMREELERIRESGYALSDEELVRGLCCVGAPIRERTGQVVAAISISGARAAILDGELSQRVRLVREAAFRISAQLGYLPPTSNLESLVSSAESCGDERSKVVRGATSPVQGS